MATIAELQTKLTVDSSEFSRGMANAEKGVQGFSNRAKLGFAAAAAAITGGVVLAVKSLVNVMDEAEKRVSDLVDAASRLGVGVGPLQQLHFAAQQSGISIGSMDSALGKMLKNIGAAARQGEGANNVFSRLGLSATALAQMGVDKQYLAIAQAIAKLPTASEQAIAAQEAWGKSGIEQLSAVHAGVDEAFKAFDDLGISLTTTQAESLESYGDSVDRMGLVWEGFENQLAAALAGPFQKILEWIMDSVKEMGGLGQVAQSVAGFVLNLANGMVGFFGEIYKGVQATIIAAEELLIILLRISQLGTLGLSNINLPGGLGGAGDKIAALKEDVNKRSASYIGAQNAQQKIQVEIKAASGFVAEVVNSPENTGKINATVIKTFNSASSAEQ